MVSTRRKVRIKFADGSSVSRELVPDSAITGDADGLKYLEIHPSPGSFILRRIKLLDFMTERPGNRYHRIISLMNMDWLNDIQDAISNAYEQVKRQQENTERDIKNIKEVFPEISTKTRALTQEQIIELCNEKLRKVNFDILHNSNDINGRLSELNETRNPANQERLTQLEFIVSKLTDTSDLNWTESVQELNETRKKNRNLAAQTVHADQLEIISDAHNYFKANSELTACPVCERKFDENCPYSKVLESLTRRVSSLKDFNKSKSDNERQTTRLVNLIDVQSRNLFNALREAWPCVTDEEIEDVQKTFSEIQSFQQNLVNKDRKAKTDKLDIPGSISKLNAFKQDVLERLEGYREKLTQSSPKEVEEAYKVLLDAKRMLPKLKSLTQNLQKQSNLADKLAELRQSFKRGRNKALKKIFSQIAGTVKQLYDLVHADSDRCEISECTAIKMKPSSEGRGRGVLRFFTDFLGTVKDCDPMQFLSEGHQDSLGLCIYLALVKHFNPSGSLLVLDDVLTSIDKNHRHKVTDLLFSEFKDYQVIITTHDDPWFDQLKNRIISAHRDEWKICQFDHWTRGEGPIEKKAAIYRKSIQDALKNGSLMTVGGPMRILIEEICQKTAEALELKMPYRRSGEYYSTDFRNNRLGEELKKGISRARKRLQRIVEESAGGFSPEQKAKHDEKTERLAFAAEKVIGCRFLNELVHSKKPDLEKIPPPELNEFAENLLQIHTFCCNGAELDRMKKS
jgi:hypothetical protein